MGSVGDPDGSTREGEGEEAAISKQLCSADALSRFCKEVPRKATPEPSVLRSQKQREAGARGVCSELSAAIGGVCAAEVLNASSQGEHKVNEVG